MRGRLGLVTVVVAVLTLAPGLALPAEVAIHWGETGIPDGRFHAGAYLISMTLLVTGAWLALALAGTKLGTITASIALLLVLSFHILIVAANFGRPSWSEARTLDMGVLLVVFVVAGAVSLAAVRYRR